MAKGKSAKSLKGIHRVRKKLSGGAIREYHYAYRGGPKFWTSDSGFDEGSQEYALAFAEALAGHSFTSSTVGKNTTRAVIDRYVRSAHFVNLGPISFGCRRNFAHCRRSRMTAKRGLSLRLPKAVSRLKILAS